MTSAYPVLSRHGVPFTVYVPTAFPDGLGEAWWLALEAVIAREDRISLVMDRKEQHFNIATTSEKYQLYDFLSRLDALARAAGSVASRSTISASDTPSISRHCRAKHRWTGTISRGLRPIRW